MFTVLRSRARPSLSSFLLKRDFSFVEMTKYGFNQCSVFCEAVQDTSLSSCFFFLSSDPGPAKKMNKGLSTEIRLAENKRYYEYHVMLTHEQSRDLSTMMMRFSFAELTFLLRRNDKIRFSINVYCSAKPSKTESFFFSLSS
jgi:hypothetical protein